MMRLPYLHSASIARTSPSREVLNTSTVLVLTAMFLCSFAVFPVAYAADGILNSKGGFNAMVLQAMAGRATIVAGEFEYKIVRSKGKGSKIEWIQQGIFRFDERDDLSAHAFKRVLTEHAADQNPSGAKVGGSVVIKTDDGLQVTGGGVFSPEMSFLFHPQSGVGYAKSIKSRRPYPYLTPFNFRAFGFAFVGDYLRKTSFDTVLSNYLALDDSKVPDVKPDDLPTEMRPAIKGARYFNYGGCIICIESDRDYWATRARFTTPKYKKLGNGKRKQVGEQLHSDCAVELTRVDGFWVPKRTIYTEASGKFVIDFEWKSVNPQKGSIEFTPDFMTENILKQLR